MSNRIKIILLILFCLFSIKSQNVNIKTQYSFHTYLFKYEKHIKNYIDNLNLKYDYQKDFFNKYLLDIYIHSYKPSIVTAQAILESNWGRCKLSENNNLFGIKGSDIIVDTKEYINGNIYNKKLSFKKFDSIKDQIDYHNKIWGEDMINLSINESIDYLISKNYATDPDYGNKIKKIIKTYNLDYLDENIIAW